MKLYTLLAPIVLVSSCYASFDQEQKILSDSKIKTDLHIKAIVSNHDKPNFLEAHKKLFKGDSLAYVTPWNNRGMIKLTRIKNEKVLDFNS